jgi:hypothetical protein
MSKPFDIYDYVHNNKITLKVQAERKANNVSKGYNDIRKTNLNEVKIVNGKFNLKESLEGDKRPLSNEVKRHFLEIISTYNTYQDQMRRASEMTEIAETLGGILEAAKELSLREANDWFDAQTVKRNMSELDKMGKQFDKFAVEAKSMDERLHALYEDMGHILNRYYEIADISPNTMKERLAMKEVKYPTELQIGSVIMGQGFPMLQGIEGGKYYKVVAMDDYSATLSRTNETGKLNHPKKIRHKLNSIEGGIKTAKRGDENGIILIKK